MQLARSRGSGRPWSQRLAGLTAASLLLGLAGPLAMSVPAQAAASDLTDGLALWYKLDAASGTTVADASGNGRTGTVNGTAGWSNSGDGLAFNGSDTYIKVPDNIMSGMNSISVSMDVKIDSAQSNPYFIYGFGNTSGTAGNGYLFTTGNAYRTSIASGNWSTEQTTRNCGHEPAARGLEADHLHPDRQHGRALRGRRGGRPQHGGHPHPRLHRLGHHDRQLHRQVGLPRRQPVQGQHPRLPGLQPGAGGLRGRGTLPPRRRAGRRRRQVGPDPGRHQRGDRRPDPAERGPRGRLRHHLGHRQRLRGLGLRRGHPPGRRSAGRPRHAHGDPQEGPGERHQDLRRHRPGHLRRRHRHPAGRRRADRPERRRRTRQPHAAVNGPLRHGRRLVLRRTRTSSRPTVWSTAPRTAPAARRST